MCSPCLCTLSASASIHLPVPTFGRSLLELFFFLISCKIITATIKLSSLIQISSNGTVHHMMVRCCSLLEIFCSVTHLAIDHCFLWVLVMRLTLESYYILEHTLLLFFFSFQYLQQLLLFVLQHHVFDMACTSCHTSSMTKSIFLWSTR